MNENTYLERQIETMGENSFMKSLLKKRLNQKGLTLIELLAVIVILAIVAAIAVPAIANIIESSRIKSAKSDAVMIIDSARLYETTSGTTIANSTALTATELAAAVENQGSFTSLTVTKNASGDFEVDGTWGEGSNTYTFTDATVDDLSPINGDLIPGTME